MRFGFNTSHFANGINVIKKKLKKKSKQVPIRNNLTADEFKENVTETSAKPMEVKGLVDTLSCNVEYSSTAMDKMKKDLEDYQVTIFYLAKALKEEKEQNIQLKMSLAAAMDKMKKDLEDYQFTIFNLTKDLTEQKEQNIQLKMSQVAAMDKMKKDLEDYQVTVVNLSKQNIQLKMSLAAAMDKMKKDFENDQVTVVNLTKDLTELKEQNIQLKMSQAAAMDKMKKDLEDYQFTIFNLTKDLTEQKEQNIQLKMSQVAAMDKMKKDLEDYQVTVVNLSKQNIQLKMSLAAAMDKMKKDFENDQVTVVNLTKDLKEQKEQNIQLKMSQVAAMDKMKKDFGNDQVTVVNLTKDLKEQKEQNIQLKMSLAAAENRMASFQAETRKLEQELDKCQSVIINLTKKLQNKKEDKVQSMEWVTGSEKSPICTQNEKFSFHISPQTESPVMRNVTTDPVLVRNTKPAAKIEEIPTKAEPVLIPVRKPASEKDSGVQNQTVSEQKRVPALLPGRLLKTVATSDQNKAFGKSGLATKEEKDSVQSNEKREKMKTETKMKSPTPVKGRGLVKNVAGFTKQEEKTVQSYFHSPEKIFCQLSNCANNCWMNSSVQAIANLQTVKTALSGCAREHLMPSPVPLFSEFFLKVLNNPGRYFSSGEILPVLKDISWHIPSLQLAKQNDIADFLNPVLKWLDDCGVQSSLEVSHVRHCNNCGQDSTDTNSVGNLAFMFTTQPNDSTKALLDRMIFDNATVKTCSSCQSKTSCSSYLNSPDVVALYLPRGFSGRDLVIPDATIEIPQQTGAQKYNLASVICHEQLLFGSAHFYTYVNYRNQFIKANDTSISVAKSKGKKDMYENGIIYVYERCS
ncbi:uncharacterized protein gdpd5b isoform X1 [Nothobranchius furzeri]|uniref:uncharacterized protein gdpd5b isoform X1 n=1 Tax=Nothobranchius furzeri TaxID=105023 RepID=UPI003904B7BE